MSQFRLVKIVAAREFLLRLRSKAFLASLVITTLILLAIIIIPTLGGDGEPGPIKLGTLAGRANDLQAAIADAPSDSDVQFTTFATRQEAEAALRRDDVEAVLLGGDEVLVGKAGFLDQSTVPDIVYVGSRLLQFQQASSNSGLSIQELAELTQPALNIQILDEQDSNIARTIIAYIGMMVTYLAILMYGSWTMAGVMEEKTTKVVETIVSTLRPRYLLAGKVIGIGALAFLQIGVLVIAGSIAATTTGILSDFGGLPVDSLVMLLIWFIVGFSFYNTLFAATGALINQIDDAQAANLPLSLVAVGSMMTSYAALNDPNGLAAIIGSYVPLSAPFVVPIRYALNAIATWELALTLTITVAFAVLAVLTSGRIYEGALLRSGGRVKLAEAWRGDS